jgi:hypothetical protein
VASQATSRGIVTSGRQNKLDVVDEVDEVEDTMVGGTTVDVMGDKPTLRWPTRTWQKCKLRF